MLVSLHFEIFIYMFWLCFSVFVFLVFFYLLTQRSHLRVHFLSLICVCFVMVLHSLLSQHFYLSLSKCLKLKAWVVFPRWKHWLRSFLWKLVNIKSHSSKISTEGDDCILTWFPGVKNRSTANIFKNKKVCMHVLDKKNSVLFFTSNLDFVFDFEHEILPVMFL